MVMSIYRLQNNKCITRITSRIMTVVISVVLFIGCDKENICYPKPNTNLEFSALIAVDRENGKSGNMKVSIYLDEILINKTELESYRPDRQEYEETQFPYSQGFELKISTLMGKSKVRVSAECNDYRKEVETIVTGDIVSIIVSCDRQNLNNFKEVLDISLESTTQKKREKDGFDPQIEIMP